MISIFHLLYNTSSTLSSPRRLLRSEAHRLCVQKGRQFRLARAAIRARTGAFAQLYEACSSHLYALLLRMLKRRDWADEALQDCFLRVWQKADTKYPYSPENTGMTLAPVKEYPSYVSSTPTSCQMKRPG